MSNVGRICVGVVWNPIKDMENIYIGRNSKNPSPLANPYIINSQCSREQACKRFEPYLRRELKLNPEIKAELTRIATLVMTGTDVNLTCYCKGKEEKQCHGEYIKQVLDNAIAKKLKNPN